MMMKMVNPSNDPNLFYAYVMIGLFRMFCQSGGGRPPMLDVRNMLINSLIYWSTNLTNIRGPTWTRNDVNTLPIFGVHGSLTDRRGLRIVLRGINVEGILMAGLPLLIPTVHMLNAYSHLSQVFNSLRSKNLQPPMVKALFISSFISELNHPASTFYWYFNQPSSLHIWLY